MTEPLQPPSSSNATSDADRPDVPVLASQIAAAEADPDIDTDPDNGEFEMESVNPTSHRRRRSSLGPGHASSSSRKRSPRPKGQSAERDNISGRESDSEMMPLAADDGDLDILSDEDLHDDEETGLTGKDKQRKKRRREHNTRVDQRVARDIPDVISDEEKKEADRHVLKRLLINLTLIGLWYFFSLMISLVSSCAQLQLP